MTTEQKSDPLDLLEKILQGTNAVSLTLPTIVSLIGVVRRGRDEGKSDDEVQAESMTIVDRVIDKGRQQMGDQA